VLNADLEVWAYCAPGLTIQTLRSVTSDAERLVAERRQLRAGE
jgi:hypothetical protein